MTGWGQESDREMSRAAGFDHHLVKPVEMDRLLEVLTTAAVRSGELPDREPAGRFGARRS